MKPPRLTLPPLTLAGSAAEWPQQLHDAVRRGLAGSPGHGGAGLAAHDRDRIARAVAAAVARRLPTPGSGGSGGGDR